MAKEYVIMAGKKEGYFAYYSRRTVNEKGGFITIPIFVELDHPDICKFPNKDEARFTLKPLKNDVDYIKLKIVRYKR